MAIPYKRVAVAIDFDGTLCVDNYPGMGPEITPAINLCRYCAANNVALILWTCRSGEPLKEAVAWCEKHGIVFDAVNANLPDWIAAFETLHPGVPVDCRKVAADIYVDDKANGGFLDWDAIRTKLKELLDKNKELFGNGQS